MGNEHTESSQSANLVERIMVTRRHCGTAYSLVYGTRLALDHICDGIDRWLVGVEQRRGVVEPWTRSSRRFTAEYLRSLYNTYDWSQGGEEWTLDAEWKQKVVDELMAPNIREDTTVLEIGPGGGRWTEYLQKRARKLYVVDVAERALEICRQRFSDATNIEYVLGKGNTLAVPDQSIDAVWSFDVFVHINPLDTRGYFEEFDRVLKPGGTMVLHHPGDVPVSIRHVRPGGRSDLTNAMVLRFASERRFEVLQQSRGYKQRSPDDFVTVLRKRQ